MLVWLFRQRKADDSNKESQDAARNILLLGSSGDTRRAKCTSDRKLISRSVEHAPAFLKDELIVERKRQGSTWLTDKPDGSVKTRWWSFCPSGSPLTSVTLFRNYQSFHTNALF